VREPTTLPVVIQNMSKEQRHPDSVVLVVEDEPIVRLDTAETLQQRGLTVVEAATAADALKILETRPEVRLVFTDMGIPGRIKGMDLARLVHQYWPHILLVITSGGERPDEGEIPDAGRFIAKPYSPEQVAGEIDELLRKD